MTAVDIQHVTKHLGTTRVLDDLSLTIDDGSITAILGQSGSGKTTLLRAIAGLARVDAGSIRLGNTLVDGPRRHVQAERRGIGYVPQDGALFPHLTVGGNIGFGIRGRDRTRIDELLELVDMTGYAHRHPGELSGGQQQRVALARALAVQPRLVLLDEPFSSLDSSLRSGLRRDLKRILKEAGTTAILVTHDQGEALSIADEIALLAHGRIVEVGRPQQLYTAPRTPTTARDLGDINALPGTITDAIATCALGDLPVTDATLHGPATVLVRPEQLVLTEHASPDATAAHVVELEFFGHDAIAHLTLRTAPELPMIARLPWPGNVVAGQQVWVTIHGRVLAELSD